MTAIDKDIELKRWVIWDTITRNIIELTDKQFQEGLENYSIKLRGDFFNLPNNNDRIWIDGVIK